MKKLVLVIALLIFMPFVLAINVSQDTIPVSYTQGGEVPSSITISL